MKRTKFFIATLVAYFLCLGVLSVNAPSGAIVEVENGEICSSNDF